MLLIGNILRDLASCQRRLADRGLGAQQVRHWGWRSRAAARVFAVRIGGSACLFGRFSCAFGWPSDGRALFSCFFDGRLEKRRLERIRNRWSFLQPMAQKRNFCTGKVFAGNNEAEARGHAVASAACAGPCPTVATYLVALDAILPSDTGFRCYTGETEAKGLNLRSMGPDLPNSHIHCPSLYPALLPLCFSRGIASPQNPLPSLAGTLVAMKPSILLQLP